MSQANSLSSSLLLEKQEERPGIRDRNENSIISGNRQQTHSGRTSYRAKARKMISNSNPISLQKLKLITSEQIRVNHLNNSQDLGKKGMRELVNNFLENTEKTKDRQSSLQRIREYIESKPSRNLGGISRDSSGMMRSARQNTSFHLPNVSQKPNIHHVYHLTSKHSSRTSISPLPQRNREIDREPSPGIGDSNANSETLQHIDYLAIPKQKDILRKLISDKKEYLELCQKLPPAKIMELAKLAETSKLETENDEFNRMVQMYLNCRKGTESSFTSAIDVYQKTSSYIQPWQSKSYTKHYKSTIKKPLEYQGTRYSEHGESFKKTPYNPVAPSTERGKAQRKIHPHSILGIGSNRLNGPYVPPNHSSNRPKYYLGLHNRFFNNNTNNLKNSGPKKWVMKFPIFGEGKFKQKNTNNKEINVLDLLIV